MEIGLLLLKIRKQKSRNCDVGEFKGIINVGRQSGGNKMF